MVGAESKIIVLLACSNAACVRNGIQLEYYFRRADLRQMVEEGNKDVIICPGCRHERSLTRDQKDSIRVRFFAAKSSAA